MICYTHIKVKTRIINDPLNKYGFYQYINDNNNKSDDGDIRGILSFYSYYLNLYFTWDYMRISTRNYK